MGIDWSSAWAAGQHTSTAAAVVAATTAAPVVAATTTAAAVVVAATTAATKAAATTSASLSSTVSSLESSLLNNLELLWDGLVGASNYRTAFGEATSASGSTGDNYVGNVGFPYGSNVIHASSSDSDYTITFKNTASSGMTINVWQKIGPDGQVLSGSALAPKNTTLTFYLASGASHVVAIQENTQVAWAEACSDFTASGAYATTWGEANFVSTGSGYDVSAIMNPNDNNYDMTITSTEAPDCTSSRTENFWLTASDPVGDSNGSCYIAQSTAHLTVEMGGTI
jgi:hypothetical protein